MSNFFLKCFYCFSYLTLGSKEFHLCRSSGELICYLCSLQRKNRFGSNIDEDRKFPPFTFLNSISDWFVAKRAYFCLGNGEIFLKNAAREFSYLQPQRFFNCTNLFDNLTENVFRRTILDKSDFYILAMPIHLYKIRSACRKFYNFRMICIPVHDSRNSFNSFYILNFNFSICPVRMWFRKFMTKFFKRVKNRFLKISQFTWYIEPTSAPDQPGKVIFINCIQGTRFVKFFQPEKNLTDRKALIQSYHAFDAQYRILCWNVQHEKQKVYNIPEMSKFFNKSWKYFHNRKLHSCVCGLCYYYKSDYAVFSCNNSHKMKLLPSIMYQ